MIWSLWKVGVGKGARMLVYHRRKALLDTIVQSGSLTVVEAARQLGVSEVTIRIDLTALERQGKIRRVRGGAVLAYPRAWEDVGVDSDHDYTGFLAAQRAAAMVEDGEAIAITAGRASVDLARALVPRRQLVVVTDSLEVAHVLADERTNTVILVGGVVRASGVVQGSPAMLESLAALRVSRIFVAARHFSAELGVLADSLDMLSTWRALVALASEVIVLVECVDLSSQGIASVVPVKDISHLILDERAPARVVDAMRLAGVTVSLCGSSMVTVPPMNSRSGTYKIAFANLSETEVFTAQVRHSIEVAAQQAGNIELLLADNNADGETALRNAEQFIAQGADLVIEFQMDESYAYRLMHRFRLAHIPVIAIDIPHPGATYYGIDNYAAGWIAGEVLAKEIAQRWGGRLDHLIALDLPQAGSAVAARIQGQIDALRETIRLEEAQISALDSENHHDASYRKVHEVLVATPYGTHLAVIGICDPAVLGAIAALRETGHSAHAMAVTQGADRLALEELQRPDTLLVGAVVFNPETYGGRIIPLALDVLSGKDVPPAVYQPHRLIRAGEAPPLLSASHVASVLGKVNVMGPQGERRGG